MIDANAVEHTIAKPPDNPVVRLLKDIRALNADADQGIDVEEATITKLLVGRAPIGQSIILQIEEGVESIGVLVDFVDCQLNGWCYFRLLCREAQQEFVKDSLIAMARREQV